MKMGRIAIVVRLLVTATVLFWTVSLCLAEPPAPGEPTASSGSAAPEKGKRRGATSEQRKAAAARAAARRAAAAAKGKQGTTVTTPGTPAGATTQGQ